MTDYSRLRDRIARLRQERLPHWELRDIDDALKERGYPAARGTYARLMNNMAPSRHLIIAMSYVLGVTVDELCPLHEFRELEDCRIRSCPDHGVMIPERGPYT